MNRAKERLAHLKKQYGENDPYYIGFAACLWTIEQSECEWKKQLPEAEMEIMKALEDQKDLFLANGVFVRDALALLNRKNAENEKLCGEVDELIIAKDQLFDEAEALIKKARAEAIKEVLYSVKTSSNVMEWVCSGTLVRKEYIITEESLDQIAKEMGVEL